MKRKPTFKQYLEVYNNSLIIGKFTLQLNPTINNALVSFNIDPLNRSVGKPIN